MLGLCLAAEGPMLRLSELRSGQPILTGQELKERAEQQVEQARQRADALEAEVARLRAALPKSKGKKKDR